MSRTPGKTKHLQTLELPDFGITLCDCPGLVFPSVVATKAHLAINGTVPLTELREPLPSARLVVEKVASTACWISMASPQAPCEKPLLALETRMRLPISLVPSSQRSPCSGGTFWDLACQMRDGAHGR